MYVTRFMGNTDIAGLASNPKIVHLHFPRSLLVRLGHERWMNLTVQNVNLISKSHGEIIFAGIIVCWTSEPSKLES